MNKKITIFEEFGSKLLQDSENRKEYEILKLKYNMIKSLIEQRNQLCMSQSHLA